MKPLAPERLALLKAADLIDRVGWLQGNYRDEAGRACALGAINFPHGWTPAALRAAAVHGL